MKHGLTLLFPNGRKSVLDGVVPRFGVWRHPEKLNILARLCHGLVLALLILLAWSGKVQGQTDFAPGEIMFTGYRSVDPDAFSIVLLTDVVSGTVIYITDRGWSNTSGFRNTTTGEGTISFTFTTNYPCGTSFLFSDIGGTNDWQATDANGNVVGTVVIQPGGDVDGMELGTAGDQLFIYQLPTPTFNTQGSFITMIQMDNNYSPPLNSNEESEIPSIFSPNQIVRFNSEWDYARYGCDPYSGTSDALQMAITNDNGFGFLIPDPANFWTESNAGLSLAMPCSFCCSIPGAPSLSGPDVVNTNQMFTITITGNLAPGESWQLFTSGCGMGSPLQTTMSNTFMVTAPPTAQSLTYYVLSTGSLDCPDLCGTLDVCVVTNANAVCTDCTANMFACGPCYLPDPTPNPDLDSGCYSIRLIFILDESGSIQGNQGDVANGVLAFLNALNGQDMEVALIEFSDLARVVNNYTPINNAYINNIQNYFNPPLSYNGHNYIPTGGTNWHDAMIKADAMESADMIMFFTDGIPTGWTNGAIVNYCGNGATTQTPEIVNPVKIANKLKGEGTHMFMLGVGGGIDEYNLALMSGFTEYESGVNTIGTSDFSIGNFEDLADDLEAFVSELCNTPFELDKQVFGAVCDGVQQFMFIIRNPGTESAATLIHVIDTFPNGYENIMYNGNPLIKLCIGANCVNFGLPSQPENAFIWITNSLPPGESDTLILSVNVLPSGNYTNIAWAQGNNTALVSDTVTSPNFVDDLDPIITCPGNITIECPETTLPPATGQGTAIDPDGSTPEVTYEDVTISGDCPTLYVIHRTWTAIDGCNNTDDCVQIITVEDTSPPEITCPGNFTVSCEEDAMPEVSGFATAIDLCDPEVMVTYDDVTIDGVCQNEFFITRTWIATDECGNSSTCVQTIEVGDFVAPAITCPANVTIACSDSTLPANTGNATGTDNCGEESPTLTYTDAVVNGSCQQSFTINRTWSATDDCDNSNTCIQIITVEDNQTPMINCPADITIECSDSTLPANTGISTGTDNCDGAPAVTYTDVTIASPDCPQEYTITRTWRATDDCDHSATCVQTILVVDSTPPVITCPANMTIECTSSTLPAITGSATATDNCDGSPDITYDDVTIPSPFCPQEYTITRTWTATDACGNVSNCTQVIVVDDSTSPAITCPADITIECTAVTLPSNTGSATVSDNCDPAPEVIYADVTSSLPSCEQEYTITRTWTATDTCGNSSSCVQIISIVDTTPPEITCPEDVTIECIDDTSPVNTGNATATDLCDPAPEVAYTDVTTAVPETHGYLIDRTWTATDACGNEATCLQVITVLNPLDPGILGEPFDTICSGEMVVFEAEDQGINPITYTWSFGSGSNPGMANGIGPHDVQYVYDMVNGTTGAWVLLTVSTPGCEDVTDTVANIHVNSIPNATIITSGGNPCVLGPKTFQPQASEMPGYTYMWNFGSGADIPEAMGYGPHTVEYFTPGVKTIQLIVFTNEAGASCGDTATLNITVNTCPGNITGRVFKPDGTGISGVNIRLYADQNLDGVQDNNTAIRSVFTTSTGGYAMATITPGYYVLVQTQPSGYFSLYDEDASEDFDSLSNFDPNDNIIPVTVEPSEVDADNYFVEFSSPGIISGYVFQDFDNNEAPIPIEGLGGVTVDLYTDTDQNGVPDVGGLVQTAVTTQVGYYAFGDIAVGDYVIVEQQPAGFNSVKDFDASNDGDVVQNTDMMDDIIPVTLTNAENDAHNYFIELSPCSKVVTTPNDNVPGSLRYMVDCTEDGDTITFHPLLQGQILHLNAGRIEIDKNLFIHSGLNPRIMIQSDVNGAFKVFQGKSVQFKNINVRSGLSGFPGAAFDNYGHLTLWDVVVFRNVLLPPGDYLIFNGMPGMITVKGSIEIDED